MNTQFFKGCKDPGQVKSLYRDLAMRHHPDRGGDTATMQDVNAAYLLALQMLDGFVSKGTDDKDHTYKYNDTRERDLIAKYAAIIRAKLPDHITVEIVGIYIWVSGTSKADTEARAALKELKLVWHSKRLMWYWKPTDYRTRYNARLDYDDLKNLYGCETVEKKRDHYTRSKSPALIGA